MITVLDFWPLETTYYVTYDLHVSVLLYRYPAVNWIFFASMLDKKLLFSKWLYQQELRAPFS